MSNLLRNPWLTACIHEKLVDGIAERDGGAVAPGKVLDTIGPLGELQFPGEKFKPLQIIQFLSLEDPFTAILSDKSAKITCKFSSIASLEHHATHGCIKSMRGGIIKPRSYEIQFFGVDGRLFWKGVTYQNQIADGPISHKTGNHPKQDHRNAGINKPIANVQEMGNPKANFRGVPTPEPMLYITSFDFIGSAGSATWGNPTNISSKPDIKDLLAKLPRKRYTKEEIPVGFKHSNRSMGAPEATPLRRKRNKGLKIQGGEDSLQSFSRKNYPSKTFKAASHTAASDDEIRSQPEKSGDEEGEEEEGPQLALVTQIPEHFPSTFDDLDFSTQVGQKKAKTSPLTSPLPSSSFRSTAPPPQVVIITNLQQNKKNSTPHKTKADVGRKPGVGPKFINYSDGTGFAGSTASTTVNEDGSMGMLEASSNRYKRKFEQYNPYLSESGLADAKTRKEASSKLQKESLTDQGWQGMTTITKMETVIPRDQQELLDQPESWYPYQNGRDNQYTSGYSLVPKVQPIPRSHSLRNQSIPPTIIPTTSISSHQSYISSSDDEEIPWPSSPVRPLERDINTMPPDSSMPSGLQSHYIERKNAQNNQQSKSKNMGESLHMPQRRLTSMKVGSSEEKGSPAELSSDVCGDFTEEIHKSVATDKRITRATNGISKKAPVDPNNVEPIRMAKANQRHKVSVARKRPRAESESQLEGSNEECESSEDDVINDPNLPFEVVNPQGRTRVDKFGGILKAQQVEMWQKRKQRTRDSQGNTEDEMQCSDDDQALVEKPGSSDENGRKFDDLQEAARDIAGLSATKLGLETSKKQNIQDTDHHSHSARLLEFMNKPVGRGEEGKQYSNGFGFPPPPTPASSHTAPEVEGRKTLEKCPDSSVRLPMAKHIDIHTDDEDEIPQAPLVPLNIAKSEKTKAPGILKLNRSLSDRAKESVEATKIASDNKKQVIIIGSSNPSKSEEQLKYYQATPSDSHSTHVAIPSQISSSLIVPDTAGDQDSVETLTSSSFPPSTSNTAPTIQVEETPYRKDFSKVGNSQCSSPTISKSRVGTRYSQDEFDDITLIPGTNAEELQNSSAPIQLLATSLLSQKKKNSPQEGRVVSLDHASSSAEISHLDDSPDDFAMSQQLQREMQEHTKIEVLATSEVDDVRAEDIRPQSPSSRKPAITRKFRRPIKSVDFQSQEIHAANAVNDVSGMLVRQKRQFLGLEDGDDFGSLDFEGDYSCSANKNLSGEFEAFNIRAPANTKDENSPGSVSLVENCMFVTSDYEDVSSISQPKIRKRLQPSPSGSNVPKPAKKPRADDKSIYEIDHHSVSASSLQHMTKNKTEINAESPNESQSIAAVVGLVPKDREEAGSELDKDGPPIIRSPVGDKFGSTLLPCSPSKPEIYAGIRERHLCVPGYGKLTDDQKKELDIRRQEYFGVAPRSGTKRLLSAGLQQAMQKASLSTSKRKRVSGSGAGEAEKSADDAWYRDENTPLKVFYKKLKNLKQVKVELTVEENKTGGVRVQKSSSFRR